MPTIQGPTGNKLAIDSNGRASTGLFDVNGNEIFKAKGGAYATTDRLLAMMGVNDNVYRPIRVDRFGGLALERFTPIVNLAFYTAALPPAWLQANTTQAATYSASTGALLNSGSITTANTYVALISYAAIPKYQKSPIQMRQRARLVKGGTNGIADWGLFGSQAPGSIALLNGLVFLYGADGTLKPTYYSNSGVGAQGSDFASSIDPTRFYVWDIVLDDDTATFICQDPTLGTIVNEQTLTIQQGDPRFTVQPYFYVGARSYVSTSANSGTATQLYLSDAAALILDTDTNKPWGHTQTGNGFGSVVNPTVALTELENYANSTVPTSATLSNTTAGYTTLGGQFQFAAVAGAETDYALFGFQVPTGVKFVCTGVHIDTFNMGAAVATTPTLLQWFLGIDGTAVTLAANNFRKSLGVQNLPVGAAIGAQANTLDSRFSAPFVTQSGRFFHVALKMPVGTATASQIVRGIAQVEGYFE
jgi:hypothetical protein